MATSTNAPGWNGSPPIGPLRIPKNQNAGDDGADHVAHREGDASEAPLGDDDVFEPEEADRRGDEQNRVKCLLAEGDEHARTETSPRTRREVRTALCMDLSSQ